MPLLPFLTAYDPSDLPGNSIDPLGFDRGYGVLAEKLLPGLTNVASEPRYFSLLCAGAVLGADCSAPNPRAEYDMRREIVLRLERFWALALVVASREDESLTTQGLRGVLRATRWADELTARNADRWDARYQLLSRQERYGAIGIYGAVADGLKFLDRSSFTLTPDLGDRLGDGFLVATRFPMEIRRAVLDDGSVRPSTLAAWGARAHLRAPVGEVESGCLSDAAFRDPIRGRMLDVLADHPWKEADRSELDRLERIVHAGRSSADLDPLCETVVAILAFEAVYRALLLGFERILYRCRESASGFVASSDLASDEVLHGVAESIASLIARLDRALDEAATPWFRDGLERLADLRAFLHRAFSVNGARELIHVLVNRHAEVQRGKLDGGRPKLPWVSESNGRIVLTLARAGGLRVEPNEIEQVAPHPYRLAAADALRAAARPA